MIVTVPFLIGFIVVVSLVGTIAMWATIIKARQILPKNKFGPFVSNRRRSFAIAVAVLFGLSGLALILAVIDLLNTPSSSYNGTTLLFLGAAIGCVVLTSTAMGFAFHWALVNQPHYTFRGERRGD